MSRGFKVAKGWERNKINLPKRQTKNSAGYDFEASEDVVIPSIWKNFIKVIVFRFSKRVGYDFPTINFGIAEEQEQFFKPTLVHTGVKAYMNEDEALFLYNRSSNPLKRFILLANGVGVIDSDYYENPKNDGEIMFQFINFGLADRKISKGERIGQGVFKKFLKADDDKAGGERKGGLGSTS